MQKSLAVLILFIAELNSALAATVTLTTRVDQANSKILVDVSSPALAGQSGQVTFGASWQVSQSGALVGGGAAFDSITFPGGGAYSVNSNSVAMDVTATTTIPSEGLLMVQFEMSDCHILQCRAT